MVGSFLPRTGLLCAHCVSPYRFFVQVTPSLHGVPRIWSPHFIGTMSHYDSLPRFPICFVILRFPGTGSLHARSLPFRVVSFPKDPCHFMLVPGPGYLVSRTPARLIQIQTRQGLSRSQVILMFICPVLRPRLDLAIRLYNGSVLLP